MRQQTFDAPDDSETDSSSSAPGPIRVNPSTTHPKNRRHRKSAQPSGYEIDTRSFRALPEPAEEGIENDLGYDPCRFLAYWSTTRPTDDEPWKPRTNWFTCRAMIRGLSRREIALWRTLEEKHFSGRQRVLRALDARAAALSSAEDSGYAGVGADDTDHRSDRAADGAADSSDGDYDGDGGE